MNNQGQPVTILVAEDDPDDRMLIKEALEESQFLCDLRFVENGEELMAYLHREGRYAKAEAAPRPELILLDLNMPRKDGREALREIKSDERLRFIPIVVLTTSSAEEDVYRTYDLGVNSFITKPVAFDSFVELVSLLGRYWFGVVKLPADYFREDHGIRYRESTAR